MKDVLEDRIDAKSMPPSGQFYKTNRVLRCEQSRRPWQSRQRQFVPIPCSQDWIYMLDSPHPDK
jgi:hypothetical protein